MYLHKPLIFVRVRSSLSVSDKHKFIVLVLQNCIHCQHKNAAYKTHGNM